MKLVKPAMGHNTIIYLLLTVRKPDDGSRFSLLRDILRLYANVEVDKILSGRVDKV